MLTSASHWVQLVTQLSPRVAFGFARLINRNLEQLLADWRFQIGTMASLESECIADIASEQLADLVGIRQKSAPMLQSRQTPLMIKSLGQSYPQRL